MIALCTCLTFLAACLGANSVYAYSLGNGDPYLAAMYVAIAIGAEGVKIVTPLRIGGMTWAWRIPCAVMWLGAVIVSISFGLGFAGLTRGEAARERAATSDDYARKLAAYEDAQTALRALPKPSASKEQLDAELVAKAARAGPCRDRGAMDRTECRDVAALRIEAAKADAYAHAASAVAAARAALDAAPRPRTEDVQASQVAAMLRTLGLSVTDRTLSAWLAVLLVLVVEMGSVVSFRLAARPTAPRAAQPEVKPPVSPPRAASGVEALFRSIAPSAALTVTPAEIAGPQRAIAQAIGLSVGAMQRRLAELQLSGVADVTTGPSGTRIVWR